MESSARAIAFPIGNGAHDVVILLDELDLQQLFHELDWNTWRSSSIIDPVEGTGIISQSKKNRDVSIELLLHSASIASGRVDVGTECIGNTIWPRERGAGVRLPLEGHGAMQLHRRFEAHNQIGEALSLYVTKGSLGRRDAILESAIRKG